MIISQKKLILRLKINKDSGILKKNLKSPKYGKQAYRKQEEENGTGY